MKKNRSQPARPFQTYSRRGAHFVWVLPGAFGGTFSPALFAFDRDGESRVGCQPFIIMFGTIRKHQSWLWFIIIGVMVISMITWSNQLGKSGNGRGGGNFGVIDGHVVTETDYLDARNEAMLMYLVRNGQWPDVSARSGFDEPRETYQRLFFLRKLEELDIHTDKDSVAKFANVILREFGKGETVPLDTFVDQILKPKGMTAEDFQRFLEHYLSIQQLASVVGLNGKLVTPEELQALYAHEYQQVAVDVAFFSASNYLARVPEPTAAELQQFYTNQQAEYREPDQMQVSYVFFNVTNSMPEAQQQIGTTNLSRETDEALTRLGTNAMRYGKTQDEARAKISEILVQETAISNIYKKAVSFQNELLSKEKVSVKDLAALAKDKGLDLKTSKPFDKQFGPGDLNLGPNFPVAALFNLSEEEPFVEQPVRGTDGIYIIAFDKLIPSRIPPLAEIHTRVAADYKMARAVQMAQINGQIFGQVISNRLAQGNSFAAACAAAKVDPIQVPPFSLNADRVPEVEDRVDLNNFKQVVLNTPAGKASGFIPLSQDNPAHEGGFVVYVRERLPIDEAKRQAVWTQFTDAVHQRREAEAFELWFRREAPEALANVPLPQGSK